MSCLIRSSPKRLSSIFFATTHTPTTLLNQLPRLKRCQHQQIGVVKPAAVSGNVKFLGRVFEGPCPEMCTFGLSGCRVKPRPGSGLLTKIPREDPQEREERKKIVAGEGKNAKFCPPSPSGPHLQGLPKCPLPLPSSQNYNHNHGHNYNCNYNNLNCDYNLFWLQKNWPK